MHTRITTQHLSVNVTVCNISHERCRNFVLAPPRSNTVDFLLFTLFNHHITILCSFIHSNTLLGMTEAIQALSNEVRAGLQAFRQQGTELSNMTNNNYGDAVKQSLKRDNRYTRFVGSSTGRSVLSPEEVVVARQFELEKDLVAYLTPFLQAVCAELGPGMTVVNSETIPWLPSGNSAHYLKPDVTIIHRAMIHLAMQTEGKLYGQPVPAVIETLRVVGEAKAKVDNEGFGEICKYTTFLAQQFPDSFPLGSISRGMVFDSSEFILVESNSAAPISAIEGRFDTPGSFDLLHTFFSREDPLTTSLVKLCGKLNVEAHYGVSSEKGSVSFLGKGNSGKAFVVQDQAGPEIYVLKVVYSTEEIDKAAHEFRRLRDAHRTVGAHVARVKTDSFRQGDFFIGDVRYYYWGYLLHDLGVPTRCTDLGSESRVQICRSLNELHRQGVFHGDARVPNVVHCDGMYKWIDLHPVVHVCTDSAAICDVQTLFESMVSPSTYIEWNGDELSSLTTAYGQDRRVEGLLEILQVISTRYLS